VGADRHRLDWDEMARVDARWAILSDPAKRFDGWEREEFMATGSASIDRVMRRAARLGRPERRERALDFGRGVGRLTRALAEHFDEALGVDVSERMVAEARRVNADRPSCRFEVNPPESLAPLEDASFDLVHSTLVLQHLPGRAAIAAFLGELVRVLRPGGLLVFQLPSWIAPRHRLQPGRRAWAGLRRLGVPPEVLHRRLRLTPIRMSFVPVREVSDVLSAHGGTVLEVRTKRASRGLESSAYFVSR
jgi:SAM-dependent methyltransferase